MLQIAVYSFLFLIGVLPFVIWAISGSIWFFLASITIIWGKFILQGLKKVPSDPPTIAVITIFGKRINLIKEEGWRFFPLYPFYYGAILVNMTRKNIEINIKSVQTPDGVNSHIQILLTYRPDKEKIINFLNNGGEKGIETQIREKINERVREWALAEEFGPANWQELMAARNECVFLLIKYIAGNSITEIPEYAQEIPTYIWLRYFEKPRPQKTTKNEEPWANNNWEKVNIKFNQLSKDEQKNLKEAITKRKKELINLKTGIGQIKLEDLGIILERLNIGDINVDTEIEKRARLRVQEELEREAEKIEISHVKNRMQELISEFKITPAEALEIVQTEKGKIKKEIKEQKINISPQVLEGLNEIIKTFKRGGEK
jgi:regulator of protease activity HflC (stomatin/prohibitin superfamily)